MLRWLSIKNVVLIETLRLDLDAGLNVLTGETGAGKSIVLDALGLLLGDRFTAETVRQGATKSEIDGIFDRPKTKAFRAWWQERFDSSSDDIVIRREGDREGRSKAFLNDRPVTLAALQELAPFLVDIHGQNEHQRVLKPAVQLNSLDRFAGLEAEADAIAPLFQTWKACLDAQHAGQWSEQERLQRLDVLRFQRDEIQDAKLTVGEEAELEARLPELRNAEKLRGQATLAYNTLYGDEGSALERLGQVSKAMESLMALAPAVEPILKTIRDAQASLEDGARQLQAAAERWEADPAALDAAMTRREALVRLMKKYGPTSEAVLAHAQTIAEEIDRLEHVDEARREREAETERARQALDRASRALSVKRQKAAKELGVAVQKELAGLGLKQALFQVLLEHSSSSKERNELAYSSTGIDRVTFQWAPNPGEGIQPLKAIASGGEMSRVMLALKTVLAQTDDVPTLVFDEIDAGIGGLTAQAVGKKLRALSRHHQVLCVSHLPQIAACAHAHFQVTKQVHKTRTQATVVRLESEDRLEELARLLGSQVTPTSVQHARELLAQNQ